MSNQAPVPQTRATSRTLRRSAGHVLLAALGLSACSAESPEGSDAAPLAPASSQLTSTTATVGGASSTATSTEPSAMAPTHTLPALSASSAPPPSSSLPSTLPIPSAQPSASMVTSAAPAASVTTPLPSATPSISASVEPPPDSEADAGPVAPEMTDICAETVPDERSVDGIPAYAQCPESESAAVWSNDGVSTSLLNEGDGWTRTQFNGGYQCTEFAHRYLLFVWGVQSVPNGNAGEWCDSTPPDGLVQAAVPVHGDLIVFAPGSCGASEDTGHVAVVDIVNPADDSVTIVEQNRAGRRNTDISCAACFLHAETNDEME